MKKIFTICLVMIVLSSGIAEGVIITAANGRGADTFVTSGTPTDPLLYNPVLNPEYNYGDWGHWIVRYYEGVRSSIGYLRFDIATISGDLSGAQLILTDHSLTDGFAAAGTPIGTLQFTVYGLNEAFDTWTEGTITFNNAPGILPAAIGYYSLDLPKIERLGTITVTNESTSTSTLSALDINTLIADDTDKLITLIMVQEESNASLEFNFRSKEFGDGSYAPALMFPNAVPEPATVLLVGLGGMILRSRKRKH